MDYDSITNILTLRYDPSKKSPMKPLGYKDFLPREVKNLEAKITGIIGDFLIAKRNEMKFKHVAISLSAGVDSGLTLAMLRSVLPDVKISCTSMGFGEEDDEIHRARQLAEAYDCDFHSIIRHDVVSELPLLISIAKEPRWNLYNYYVLEDASKRTKTFFSGDGGDELFGGYTFRYQKFLDNMPRKAGWRVKAELYMACHERDWVPDQGKIFGSRVKFSWDKIYRILKPYFVNPLSPADQVFLADFNGKLLHDWLPANRAFEKFFGMSIQSIFLNPRMIRFATHIPWQLKYDPKTNVGKLPLRSILRHQKGFEKFHPVKKGFSVNLESLWNKTAREVASTYLGSGSELVENKVIDGKWVDSALRKTGADTKADLRARYINKVMLILALEVWYRLFVSKTLKKNDRL
ncbi:MAG TPA: asparagine synthase C-terminal domain-containing protein [Candidatus Nitrosotalea sp.]|nr:asparagine synthase C-terminal domain-containing protein [Candidatus Nitrosotalea sp.]